MSVNEEQRQRLLGRQQSDYAARLARQHQIFHEQWVEEAGIWGKIFPNCFSARVARFHKTASDDYENMSQKLVECGRKGSGCDEIQYQFEVLDEAVARIMRGGHY